MGKVRLARRTKIVLVVEIVILLLSIIFGFYEFLLALGIILFSDCVGFLWSYFMYRATRSSEDEDWEILL